MTTPAVIQSPPIENPRCVYELTFPKRKRTSGETHKFLVSFRSESQFQRLRKKFSTAFAKHLIITQRRPSKKGVEVKKYRKIKSQLHTILHLQEKKYLFPNQ